MDFDEALIAELDSITALGGRIYPLFAPEATKHNGVPYLIYASSEGLRDKSLDGYMLSKALQGELNIIAERYSDMKAITKQAVALLVNMIGRKIGTDGPYIKDISYQRPVEMYEPQPDLYRCLIEFTAYFDEEG